MAFSVFFSIKIISTLHHCRSHNCYDRLFLFFFFIKIIHQYQVVIAHRNNFNYLLNCTSVWQHICGTVQHKKNMYYNLLYVHFFFIIFAMDIAYYGYNALFLKCGLCVCIAKIQSAETVSITCHLFIDNNDDFKSKALLFYNSFGIVSQCIGAETA